MKPRRVLGILVAAGLVVTWRSHGPGRQDLPASEPAAPGSGQYDLLPPPGDQKWTGDLDAMVGRRMIRVLTTVSRTNYFVDRGTQRGVVYDAFRLFEVELNQKLATKDLAVHVLFVPVARDQLVPALLDGRGDVAAANLTITPERLAQVDVSDPIVRDVSEIVVTGPGAPLIRSLEDLAGQELYVRKSSSFYQGLQALNARFAGEGRTPVKIRLAPEELENEDILEMVNAGLVTTTIVDAHVAAFWSQVFPNIVVHADVAVRSGGAIGWMIRKQSPRLKQELNAFLARYPRGAARRNVMLLNYYKNIKWAKAATSKEEIGRFERAVAFFRRYGEKYDLDYVLIMAQAYQESQLRQEARSPSGAVGVMQVTPSTGKEMGVGDITRLEPNIHAGVKYFRFMMDQSYAGEPMDRLNKGLFTLASYNAGPGRIQQLRKLAAARGLDPNKWFNNVELVAAEKIGRETVQYVSNVFKYYLAYRMVEDARRERAKAAQATLPDAKH